MLHFQEVLSIYKIEFLRELTIATTYLGKSGFSLLGGVPPPAENFLIKPPTLQQTPPSTKFLFPPKGNPPLPPPKKMNIFKLQPNKNIIFRCWQLCRDSSCRKNTFVLEYYSKYVTHANNSISKDQIFKYKLTSTSTYQLKTLVCIKMKKLNLFLLRKSLYKN